MLREWQEFSMAQSSVVRYKGEIQGWNCKFEAFCGRVRLGWLLNNFYSTQPINILIPILTGG